MKRLFSRLTGKPAQEPGTEQRSVSDSSTFIKGVDETDARNLRLLLDSMASLISDPDPKVLVRKIVDRAIEVVRAERGILFLEGEGGKLHAEVARDATGRDLGDRFRYSTTVVRKVYEEGEGLCMRVGESDQPEDLSASMVDLKLRAVMCVRLRFLQKVLGVIYVDSRVTSREFTSKDLRFFDALAVVLSIALENARQVEAALERERLRESVEILRQIQLGLFPTNPQGIPGFDIAGRSIAAEAAAGDYYDFIPCADGRLGIIVGDVTGHGIGPAMIMAGARSALRTLFADDLSEAHILGRLNLRISEDVKGDLFMSMLVARLDPKARSIAYANAGESPPLLLRADGTAESVEGTGVALGIEKEFRYQNQRAIELRQGDTLLLYSDGIFEARNPAGEEYGRDRLIASLLSHRRLAAEQALESVRRDVIEFRQRDSLDDDMTLVIVRTL